MSCAKVLPQLWAGVGDWEKLKTEPWALHPARHVGQSLGGFGSSAVRGADERQAGRKEPQRGPVQSVYEGQVLGRTGKQGDQMKC